RQPTIFTNLSDWGFSHPSQALIVFAVVALALKLLLDWFLATEAGLAMRATGDNPDMIRSFGVSTETMTVLGLALANGLVSFAGALTAQYQGYADVGMGLGMIVVGLASVILGNALLRPSTVPRGTLGALLGSVVYRLAIFFALRAGFAPTDLRIVTAAIVILALSAPAIKDGLTKSRAPAAARASAAPRPSPVAAGTAAARRTRGGGPGRRWWRRRAVRFGGRSGGGPAGHAGGEKFARAVFRGRRQHQSGRGQREPDGGDGAVRYRHRQQRRGQVDAAQPR